MRVGIDHETLLKYQPSMRARAMQLCKNNADADDAVQLACEWALSAKTPDDLEHPAAWLRMFVLRAYQKQRYDHRGVTRRRVELEYILPLSICPDQFEATCFHEVISKVGELPVKQRDVFMCMIVDGDGGRVTADRLGYKDKRSAHYHLDAAMHSLGLADGKPQNMRQAA